MRRRVSETEVGNDNNKIIIINNIINNNIIIINNNIIIIINNIIISLVWRGGPGSDPDRHLALPQEVPVHLDAAVLRPMLDGVVLTDALRAVDVERLHPCRR